MSGGVTREAQGLPGRYLPTRQEMAWTLDAGKVLALVRGAWVCQAQHNSRHAQPAHRPQICPPPGALGIVVVCVLQRRHGQAAGHRTRRQHPGGQPGGRLPALRHGQCIPVADHGKQTTEGLLDVTWTAASGNVLPAAGASAHSLKSPAAILEIIPSDRVGGHPH